MIGASGATQGRISVMTRSTHQQRRAAKELGEALAAVEGAHSRSADDRQTGQPSSAASTADRADAAPDPIARLPNGAASQRMPVGEDDAVGGASVLTGEPVHLYVMGDRSVRPARSCLDHWSACSLHPATGKILCSRRRVVSTAAAPAQELETTVWHHMMPDGRLHDIDYRSIQLFNGLALTAPKCLEPSAGLTGGRQARGRPTRRCSRRCIWRSPRRTWRTRSTPSGSPASAAARARKPGSRYGDCWITGMAYMLCFSAYRHPLPSLTGT